MIKTHKNIRNVIGELIASEDFNKNLLNVLNKNSEIENNKIYSRFPDVWEKNINKVKDSVPDSYYLINKNLALNTVFTSLVRDISDNQGEFITELRLYKHLETIIINTQFLINLNFKIAFLTQKKGLSKRTYIIAKAPFYFPDAVRQEARVYVRKNATDLYEVEDGENIEKYEQNEELMTQAKEQLISSMNKSIQSTLDQFKELKSSVTYDSNIVRLYNQTLEKLENKMIE
jgi:hypothetical protein